MQSLGRRVDITVIGSHKLPPFKVTHHPQKEVTNIYRGNLDADVKALEREQSCSTVQEPSDTSQGSPINDFPEPYEDTDPTLHELYCKATVSAWEKLRSNILLLATENSAMPLDQGCMVCKSAARFKMWAKHLPMPIKTRELRLIHYFTLYTFMQRLSRQCTVHKSETLCYHTPTAKVPVGWSFMQTATTK